MRVDIPSSTSGAKATTSRSWRTLENIIVGFHEGNELGFKSMMHERNLYVGMIDGELVLLCCQVDDFAIASKSWATAKRLITVINKHATTEISRSWN
jgi:hypothetical protein